MRTTRSEARLSGDIAYDTGEPCKHGHHAPRLTSSGECTACLADPHAKRRCHLTVRLSGGDIDRLEAWIQSVDPGAPPVIVLVRGKTQVFLDIHHHGVAREFIAMLRYQAVSLRDTP